MRRSLVLAAAFLAAVFAVCPRLSASQARWQSIPRVIVQPVYTAAAIHERIEGDVGLEALVTREGAASEVRIVESLDRHHGLDDQAVAAARQWQFSPHDNPDPVKFRLALQFRLPADDLEFAKDAVPDTMPGLVKPRVAKAAKPTYPHQAMRAGIQGAVDVQVVIGTLGTVTRARVSSAAWATRSTALDAEATAALVESALAAAKAWVFKPGVLGEWPVAVLSGITVRFSLLSYSD
jgi:TonB family protein